MKIVFVNGTFDVLHPGHISLLKYAKSCGDYLIVAIDSDERVKEKKGSLRPFFSFEDRKLMLESLKYVDEVVGEFNSDQELRELLASENPDLMIVGSDWKGKEIIGSEFAKEVKFFDRIDGYSTTWILNHC